jgi:hypothetical protein
MSTSSTIEPFANHSPTTDQPEETFFFVGETLRLRGRAHPSPSPQPSSQGFDWVDEFMVPFWRRFEVSVKVAAGPSRAQAALARQAHHHSSLWPEQRSSPSADAYAPSALQRFRPSLNPGHTPEIGPNQLLVIMPHQTSPTGPA